jgi:hypothetical protein
MSRQLGSGSLRIAPCTPQRLAAPQQYVVKALATGRQKGSCDSQRQGLDVAGPTWQTGPVGLFPDSAAPTALLFLD